VFPIPLNQHVSVILMMKFYILNIKLKTRTDGSIGDIC